MKTQFKQSVESVTFQLQFLIPKSCLQLNHPLRIDLELMLMQQQQQKVRLTGVRSCLYTGQEEFTFTL